MMGTLFPPSADELTKSGAVPTVISANGGINLYFNLRKAPFNDVRARQAFIMGIDRAAYTKTLNNNLVPPLDSAFREQSPFYDSSIMQYPYDPAKAQSLFNDVATDTGGPVKFTIYSYNTTQYQTIAEYFQGVLRAFKNVDVDVQVFSVPAQTTNLTSGNFQVGIAGNPFTDPEPTFTQNYACNAQPAYTGYCDTKYDAAVTDARLTLDANKRVADIKEAQRLLYAAAPTLYFDRRYSWVISAKAVQNVDWMNDGAVLLDRVWLKR